jgi:hypothetical protein
MSKKLDTHCDFCMSTGIVSANLIKQNDEDGVLRQHHIDVVLCGGHFDGDTSDRNMSAMASASGLPVNVVGVKKPEEEMTVEEH